MVNIIKQDLTQKNAKSPIITYNPNALTEEEAEEVIVEAPVTGYTVFSSNVFKPKTTRPRPKDVYARAKTYKCCACGYSHDSQKNVFPRSYSNVYAGMNSYLPICKTCIDLLFSSMYEALQDYFSTYRRICMMFDVYYCKDLAVLAWKASRPESRMTTYIEKSANVQFAAKTYADTLFEEETALADERHLNAQFKERYDEMESRYIPLEKRNQELEQTTAQLQIEKESLEQIIGKLQIDHDIVSSVQPLLEKKLIAYKKNLSDSVEYVGDDGSVIDPASIARWGDGFSTTADYKYLDEQYGIWTSSYPCDTHADEVVFQQICMLQLRILRANQNGEAVDRLANQLNSYLDTACVKPKQNRNNGLTEGQTIGTLIKKYEDTRPLPESEPSGLAKYISTWFFGHLCKLLGIKNDEAAAYEEERSKYDVTLPSFEEEMESDVTFEDVYGGE